MTKWKSVTLTVTVIVGMSSAAHAQGVAETLKGLGPVLNTLYDKMMPLCAQLTGVGRAIAGFAALWYISSRIWRSLANAEPIDFYPLFRPFVLGFCVTIFPMVMALINGVLKPTVVATESMVEKSNAAIVLLLKQKEEALKTSDIWQMYVGQNKEGDKEKWLRYTHGTKADEETPDEGIMESVGSDISFAIAKATYRFRSSVKEWLSEILSILFEAVALCINTIRTFQLVILSILGPFVFALAVFDGLQHTLTAWIAKYINIFLWLPICNILGAMLGQIQQEMLKLDASQIYQTGDTFFSPTDTAYIIFMIIGIASYMTVPTIAGYVVQAGGGGALTQKITSMATSTATGGMSRMASGAENIGNMGSNLKVGMDGRSSGAGVAGAAGRTAGYGGAYMADKLSGNTTEKPKSNT